MTMTTIPTATFARGGDSNWFIRIRRDEWAEGIDVNVTSRNGSKTVTCGDWFEQDGPDHYLAEFTDPTPEPVRAAKARPAQPAARRRSSTPGTAPTAAQLNFAAKLLARSNWIDEDPQFGDVKPTIADLKTWTRREVSALIDSLKD